MGYVDRRSILHTRIANTADVFEKVMRNIWSSKGVDEVQYQQAATRGILDSVEGEEDTCTYIIPSQVFNHVNRTQFNSRLRLWRGTSRRARALGCYESVSVQALTLQDFDSCLLQMDTSGFGARMPTSLAPCFFLVISAQTRMSSNGLSNTSSDQT